MLFRSDCKTFCPVSENIEKLNRLIYSGTSTVAELSAESEYSVRHISRLYNEVYGIGAKDFIKMYRFQNVLAAIIADPERDNSFFIEGAGYSDQAHFQREFRTGQAIRIRSPYVDALSATQVQIGRASCRERVCQYV